MRSHPHVCWASLAEWIRIDSQDMARESVARCSLWAWAGAVSNLYGNVLVILAHLRVVQEKARAEKGAWQNRK